MKGVVFTEFFSMVGAVFSEDMVDDIIDDSAVPSGGAYTAVGTYPHEEIVALVVALSERTGTPIPDLLLAFGRHLFGQFIKVYSRFTTGVEDAFSFLASVEEVIHVEVLKLYPDATLPSFTVESRDENRLVMVYSSPRHFEDVAQGLIEGCINHYGEQVQIVREVIGAGESRSERFILIRQ